MKKSKDFSNSLAETMNILSGGKIADSVQTEPIQEAEIKQDFVKIVLRMGKDDHAALTKIALNEAARMGKRYSLTELINDILKDYLETKKE